MPIEGSKPPKISFIIFILYYPDPLLYFSFIIFIFYYSHPLSSSSSIISILYHLHLLLSPTFIILILYYPYPLSSLSFIIIILYHPHLLSSSSFIIFILYYPHPLSSASFIILILYHLHPLLSSSSIILILYYLHLSLSLCLIMYNLQIHPHFHLHYRQPYRSYRPIILLMYLLLLISNIKQDVPRLKSNLGFFLWAFSEEPGCPTTIYPADKIWRLRQFQKKQRKFNSLGDRSDGIMRICIGGKGQGKKKKIYIYIYIFGKMFQKNKATFFIMKIG